MRQGQGWRAAGGTAMPVYEWIIDLYAPYVLVRCARFTNDRNQGLIIGAYTLITACLMAEQLDHLGQLGISIDVVADMAGPDVVCAGPDGDDRPDSDGRLLLADERTQRLVEALNMLERPMREALVLHYVTGVAVDDMARMLDRPAAEAGARLAQGERLLAEHLGVAAEHGHTGGTEVRAILARFAAELDTDWVREVRNCTIDYLVRCHKQVHRRIPHSHLN